MERERLLIIEDDEDIRTQLTYALQDDYDITVAGDRARAAAAVQQSPPEIVTLDLGLPPSRTRPKRAFAPSKRSWGEPRTPKSSSSPATEIAPTPWRRWSEAPSTIT
jgi:CheY-like chemotaxis protein